MVPLLFSFSILFTIVFSTDTPQYFNLKDLCPSATGNTIISWDIKPEKTDILTKTLDKQATESLCEIECNKNKNCDAYFLDNNQNKNCILYTFPSNNNPFKYSCLPSTSKQINLIGSLKKCYSGTNNIQDKRVYNADNKIYYIYDSNNKNCAYSLPISDFHMIGYSSKLIIYARSDNGQINQVSLKNSYTNELWEISNVNKDGSFNIINKNIQGKQIYGDINIILKDDKSDNCVWYISKTNKNGAVSLCNKGNGKVLTSNVNKLGLFDNCGSNNDNDDRYIYMVNKITDIPELKSEELLQICTATDSTSKKLVKKDNELKKELLKCNATDFYSYQIHTKTKLDILYIITNGIKYLTIMKTTKGYYFAIKLESKEIIPNKFHEILTKDILNIRIEVDLILGVTIIKLVDTTNHVNLIIHEYYYKETFGQGNTMSLFMKPLNTTQDTEIICPKVDTICDDSKKCFYENDNKIIKLDDGFYGATRHGLNIKYKAVKMPESMLWDEFNKICLDLYGLPMAGIKTRLEQEIITSSMINEGCQEAWIGVTNISSTDSFSFTDGNTRGVGDYIGWSSKMHKNDPNSFSKDGATSNAYTGYLGNDVTSNKCGLYFWGDEPPTQKKICGICYKSDSVKIDTSTHTLDEYCSYSYDDYQAKCKGLKHSKLMLSHSNKKTESILILIIVVLLLIIFWKWFYNRVLSKTISMGGRGKYSIVDEGNISSDDDLGVDNDEQQKMI